MRPFLGSAVLFDLFKFKLFKKKRKENKPLKEKIKKI